MADPEEGTGGAESPLFLDETEAQRAEKKSFFLPAVYQSLSPRHVLERLVSNVTTLTGRFDTNRSSEIAQKFRLL